MAGVSANENVSSLERALLDPVTAIDEIFKETAGEYLEDAMDTTTSCSGSHAESSLNMDSFDHKVKSLYTAIFDNPRLCNSIPYLDKAYFDSGKLAPNSIVKYRGIVQDILNPEFYVGAYIRKDKHSGESCWEQSKYKDCIYCDQEDSTGYNFDGPGVVTLERLPLILAPIPGENEWVREYHQRQFNPSMGNGDISDNNNCDMTLDGMNGDGNGNSYGDEVQYNSKKRMNADNGDDCMGEVDAIMNKKRPVFSTYIENNEKQNDTIKNEIDGIQERKMGSDDSNGMCCLAKACNFKDDDFHLNDAVEVIALYSLDVAVPASSISELEDQFAEMEDLLNPSPPPPSLMPRLQILGYRLLDSSYPLINTPCSVTKNGRLNEDSSEVVCKVVTSDINGTRGCVEMPTGDLARHFFPASSDTGSDEVSTIRANLVCILSAILSGQMSFSPDGNNALPAILIPRPDADITAEYLLLALLSRVDSRSDSGLLVGAFALNIVGFHSSSEKDDFDRFQSLVSFLDSIIPKTMKIDLSIDRLNKAGTLLPSRDSKTNMMCPSPLMLAAGTLLMVDESEMSEGTLVDSGLKSFHALRSVIQKQILSIEFDYYSMSMPVDNPIILLSHSSSSVFSGDGCIVRVKVNHKEENKMQQTDSINGKNIDLDSFRKYWSCCRLLSTNMDSTTAKVAEEDFVVARQQDQRITADDFHVWLVLSRLYAASYGHPVVTVNTWKQVLDLETRRKSLNQTTDSKQ